MLLPHNKVSGGVQDSQIMIPSFFDRFYVMPPLTNGVHYMSSAAKQEKGEIFKLRFYFFNFFLRTSHLSIVEIDRVVEVTR